MNKTKLILTTAMIAIATVVVYNYTSPYTPKYKVGDCALSSYANEFQVKNYKIKILKVGKEDYWVQLDHKNQFKDNSEDGMAQDIKRTDQRDIPIACEAEYPAVVYK